MKKTKLPVTAKEFEKNHVELHYNDFADYMLGFKMDFWQYIKLKEEFIKIYKKESSKNKTYSLVNHLCNVCKEIEVEKFKERLNERIQTLPNESKLLELEKELDSSKKEWADVVPLSINNLDLISTYRHVGIDGTYEEPIEYYREIAVYIKAQIEFVKKEIWIENTRIIDNLNNSLRNFYYEDWIKKALREAPDDFEERLAYFIRLNSELKKIEELEKERKPKANYFELTRFAKVNDKGYVIDVPTSRYDWYIKWSSTQIDLAKTKFHTAANVTPSKVYNNNILEIDKDKWEFISKLLEDLAITINGKYALSDKRKGAIRGVSEALKEKLIFPERSLESLNNFIAQKIGLVINSKLDCSGVSEKYKKLTIKYIVNNYNK